MQSVLSRASPADVTLAPFPHLVIKDALEPGYYRKLMSEFPGIESVNKKNRKLANNDATFLGAADIIDSTEFSDDWKKLFRYHVSADFLKEAAALIGKPAIAMHSSLAPFLSILEKKTVGIADSGEKADFYMQCQFGMNSPVLRESSVRTAHIDNPKKIYNALLYCRSPDDDSEGGDLALYRFKGKPGFRDLRTALPNRIEEVARIPYAANTLVLFANSINSVHGVTPRKPTRHVRRYINFQVELEEAIFEIPYVSRLTSIVERVWG